jgi:hypothetical protein
VGAQSVLRRRDTLHSGNDRVGDYVQKAGYFKHRYRIVHQLALFTLGYQTTLEPHC